MTNLFSPVEFLERAVNKIGMVRERYVERNIPTDIKDILVLFFFGDYKARFLLSTILLKDYIKKIRRPRYCILCSWQGDSGLYPFVDEYWSLNSVDCIKEIASRAYGFTNDHKDLSTYESNLLRYFPGDVMTGAVFNDYYNKGLTKQFFNQYKEINYYLPSIPSLPIDTAKRLSKAEYSVFIHPATKVKVWRNSREELISIPVQFWELMVRGLLSEGIQPVVWLDSCSYDISTIFANQCIYITDVNVMNVLSAMRASTCVVDICSGISRLALIARSPFLVCDARQRYFSMKEIELDDLCASNIHHDYIFLFNNSIETDWSYVVGYIISKLRKFLPLIDRNNLMSSAESADIISYDIVRKIRAKKIGLNFIKVEQEEI